MKRFMSRLGVGSAEVETVLDRPQALPGHVITGVTTVTGGKVDQRIEVEIHPLPVQQTVLTALGDLGFHFHTADVEKGRLQDSDLPLYQEIELKPSGEYARRIRELEVTFLVDDTGTDIVLEADRRGGLLSSGRDELSRFRLSHQDTDRQAVAGALHEQLTHLGRRRGWF